MLQGQAVVGQPANLTAQATGTVDSWAWSVTPSGETGSGAGSFSFTPTGAEPGSGYTVTVTVTGCGAPPVAQSITVAPVPQCTAPTVSPPALQGQAVVGQQANLTAQATGSVDSWAWSVTPSDETGSGAGSFSFTPAPCREVHGDRHGLGLRHDIRPHRRHYSPHAQCTAPTVSQPAFQAPAVVGQLVTLTAQASGTVDSWTWSVTPSGETGSGAGSFSFTPAAAGQYTVTVTVSGCGTTSAPTDVVVDAQAQCTAPTVSQPSFQAPAVVGQPVTLTARASGTVDSWAWWVSPSGDKGTSAGSFSFTPNAVQPFTVTVVVSGCGGSSFPPETVLVVVQPLPPPSSPPPGPPGCGPGIPCRP